MTIKWKSLLFFFSLLVLIVAVSEFMVATGHNTVACATIVFAVLCFGVLSSFAHWR